ncbi:MAG: uroporphyrinogen-III C-methyltransferase [Gammaproteobacteria bacterium]
MNDEYLKSAKPEGEPAELPTQPPSADANVPPPADDSVPPSADASVPPPDRGEPPGPAPVSTVASPEPLPGVTAGPAEATLTSSVGPRWRAWAWPALFALALVTALAWRLLVLSQTSAGTQNRVAEIGSQLDGLRKETDAHAKTDTEQFARLQGAVEDQKRLQEAHGKSIEKLALLASQDSEDMIFAEVAYLLGIAQQRLSFERDVPTAIRAMEAADQRLLNLIRPDLETVRAVLMADLNDLRAVPVVDTTGPALYLADVLKRIDSLPFQGGLLRASDEDAGKRAEAVQTPRPPVQSFDETIERMWNDLIGLVSIKTLGAEDARIFDPNFRKLTEQQIHLEITNARLELSRRDAAAFKATLGVLAGLFERYYDGTDPAVASIQKRLKEMQALELSPPIPDVARSIKGLREYVLARRKLGTPEAPPQGDSAATPDAAGAETGQGDAAAGPAPAEPAPVPGGRAEEPGATRPAPDEDDRSDAPDANRQTPETHDGAAPSEGAGTVPAPAIGTGPEVPGEAAPGTVTAPGDTPAAPPTAPTGPPGAGDPETPDAAP